VLSLVADLLRQIDVHRTSQMVEPVGVARQDENLQASRGRVGRYLTLGGELQNLQDPAVLDRVRVGERIVKDGHLRLLPSENAAQRQADEQAQLLVGAVG